MTLSVLAGFLLAVFVLIGIRLALFKWFKVDEEAFALPVETTTPQEVTETTQTTYWPVVTLLCIVVTAIVSLMMFGNVLAGG